MRICLLDVKACGNMTICNAQADVQVRYTDREFDGMVLVVEPVHEVEKLLFPFKPKNVCCR